MPNLDFIVVRSLHKRHLSALLLEFESFYNEVTMFNNMRLLSRNLLFIEIEDLINVPEVDNHILINNLMFFTDSCIYMNELNLKITRFSKSIEVMFGYIKSFESSNFRDMEN